jgi:hypothetical protein
VDLTAHGFLLHHGEIFSNKVFVKVGLIDTDHRESKAVEEKVRSKDG